MNLMKASAAGDASSLRQIIDAGAIGDAANLAARDLARDRFGLRRFA
jgi:hypothetical protein